MTEQEARKLQRHIGTTEAHIATEVCADSATGEHYIHCRNRLTGYVFAVWTAQEWRDREAEISDLTR